jgi:predicted DNA-binding protein (UPF0251 family)
MGSRPRRRHGKRGRFPKAVRIGERPVTEGLTPLSKGVRALFVKSSRTIYIDPAEIEAQRLVDLQGFSQAEAGKTMGVSRGTVWRLLQAARKKVVQSLMEGRPLLILDERNSLTSQESLTSSRQKRAPPPPPPGAATCPDCGGPLAYVDQYQRWYCYKCKKYA